MTTIVFFAANPAETTRLRIDKEYRKIEENVEKSEHGNQFKFIGSYPGGI
jgi:hypothetical protein